MTQADAPASLEQWLAGDAALWPEGTSLFGLDPLGLAMALAAARGRTDRPILLVLADKHAARNFLDHYALFAGPAQKDRIHFLPAGEFDYHRGMLPNPETLCERNVALFHALNDARGRVFVTHLGALLQKVLRPEDFLRATRSVAPNEDVDRDELVRALTEAGYQRQPTAFDPGVFAVRGGVVDVYCPAYRHPVRIELFGDLVEEVRFFDPKTQLSENPVERAFLVPVGQTLFPRAADMAAVAARVKDRLDHQGIPKSRRDELLEKMQAATPSTELSLLFPLLSGGSAPLLDYFPADTLYVWDEPGKLAETAAETEVPRLGKSHELYEGEPHPVAESSDLFLSEKDLAEVMAARTGVRALAFDSGSARGESFRLGGVDPGPLAERGGGRGDHLPLEAYAKKLREWMDLGYRVHIACHTRTHAERIRGLFAGHGVECETPDESVAAFPQIIRAGFETVGLWVGYLNESRMYPELRLVLLSEEAIFGQKKRASRSSAWVSTADPARLLSSFRDLNVSDYVVHRDQGIGRYLGLKSMEVQGVLNDFVALEYRDGDKLYVPVYRLNVLQKYVGGEGAGACLDKLGGERWTKARQKAERAIAELAGELLNLHARRRSIPAHRCAAPGEPYRQFEMEFDFDETPDQQRAIDDVMADLGQSHPMDRLICGDVGYGKTEVAMRAAFRSVLDGKQVAILVPTTVLAFQHYNTFSQRFGGTGARVESISRLKTNAEIRKILDDTREGKVDVLVGTHRLLSADVAFKDLVLVIVDEEHRFGVTHKEKLKKLVQTVHYLSMTATPIPRTLNMAMTGIKDISVITTPPPDRLSVRTFVCRHSSEIIAEAISNELAREGQVFFVHNRIETIYKVAQELKELLPKVNCEVAHGQMDGETLEAKMLAFYRGESQVLLCTAIIESGLDIPRANTILIDKAHTLGLAQLYQLRGRVGRSAKRAYCYLLVPPESELTAEARERLQVIQRYTDLGSGFQVASHDLEIRGTGDLLGREQSGHLNAIGVDLYFELLDDALRELRGQEKPPVVEPEITLRVAALLPERYLPDVGERVTLYRRLSGVESEEGISQIEEEIRDRFGALPEEVLNLLGLVTLKLHLKGLHVIRMSVGGKRTSLQFASTTPASPQKIVKLVQSSRGKYSLTPDQKLVFEHEAADWKTQLKEVRSLCQVLGVG